MAERQHPPSIRRRGGARFGLAAWILPFAVVAWGTGAVVVGVARLRSDPADGARSAADGVWGLGFVITLAVIGFARTTKGLAIERARYRSSPLAAAVATAGACGAIVAAGDGARWYLQLPAGVAGAAFGALLGRAVARAICPAEAIAPAGPAATDLIRRPLAAGTTAVWSGRLPWLAPIALVRFPVLYVAWWLWQRDAGPGSRIAVAVALLVVAGLWTLDWRARATIGPAGLAVRSGLGGRTWYSIPLSAVVGATTVVARRSLWWRSPQWSIPGQTALVPRGGPALLVRLSDGTQFVLRLPDADTAAGLVNTLVDRRDAVAC